MRLKIRHKIVSLFIPRLLREIGAWARSFADGDFSRRISLSARDEMEELADPLNSMSRQVQSRMEEFIADKSRLEAVFLSMFDGVMVIDQSGGIVLMNQTLKRIPASRQHGDGQKTAGGHPQYRHPGIGTTRSDLSQPSGIPGDHAFCCRRKGCFWRTRHPFCARTPSTAPFWFSMISPELRRLEKVRQDFVANVSHELRTPVSTIRGYAETLLEGALEDKAHAREFLRIIYDDAERLSKLINDLLDLSPYRIGENEARAGGMFSGNRC